MKAKSTPPLKKSSGLAPAPEFIVQPEWVKQARTTSAAAPRRAQAPPPPPHQNLGSRSAQVLPGRADFSILPARGGLEAVLGRPKADWKIGSLCLRRMSLPYKAVLQRFDAYHQALEDCQKRGADFKTVVAALGELQQSVQAYLSGGARLTRKEGMSQLQQVLANEADRLNAIVAESKGQEPSPSAALQADMVANRRFFPELTWHQLHKARGHYGDPLDLHALAYEFAQRHDLVGGVQEAAQGLLMGADLRYDHSILHTTFGAYGRAQIPLTHATRFTATPVLAPDEPMVKVRGGVHELERVRYKDEEGYESRGYFKPENLRARPDAAREMGIDFDKPYWSARSVATRKLDLKLKTGLVPPTHFMVKEGRLGAVMDEAPGRSPRTAGALRIALPAAVAERLRNNTEALAAFLKQHGFAQGGKLDGDTLLLEHRGPTMRQSSESDEWVTEEGDLEFSLAMDWTDPVLRRELTKLQWLDALCGQVDRSPKNYFVSLDGDGKPMVAAIDNDLSFGAALIHADAISMDGLAVQKGTAKMVHPVFQGAKLPQVIDRATYEALQGLSEDDLRSELNGLLTAAEIDAAVQRLASIKAHLLNSSVMVIEDHDEKTWASAEVSGRLGVTVVDGIITADITRDEKRRLENCRYKASQVSYVAREAYDQDTSRAELAADRPLLQPLLDLDALARIGLKGDFAGDATGPTSAWHAALA